MLSAVPFLLSALALLSCGGGEGDAPRAGAAAVSTKTIATDLRVPWGVAFLPGGDALVAERTTGRILRVAAKGGRKRVVMTVPGVDTEAGEGGLLGLAVSPTYERDERVYAYYTTAGDNRIARFRLGGRPQPILTGLRRGFIHNGGRIAFGPDGKLYAGVGDVGETSLSQQRDALNGKVLRMNPDGSVPAGNPFGTAVWSMGHRNVQGLAWDRRRPPVGLGVRPEHHGRGQPDPPRAQLRLAGRRGPRGHRRRALHEPEGHVGDLRGVAERRRGRRQAPLRRRAARRGRLAGPAARRVGRAPAAALRRPLRPRAHRRARAGRRPVDRDVEPRRPRGPAVGRRPHRAGARALGCTAGGRSTRSPPAGRAPVRASGRALHAERDEQADGAREHDDADPHERERGRGVVSASPSAV
jgi:hypothetical protein